MTRPSIARDGFELLLDEGERLEERAEALQGEVLRLHRHDDAISRAQRVQREWTDRGRAVEEDERRLVAQRGEGVAEEVVGVREAGQLHIGRREIGVGREHAKARDVGLAKGVDGGGGASEDVVERRLLILRQAERDGGVRLGVGIDDDGRGARLGQARGETHGGGRLPDATLLIR